MPYLLTALIGFFGGITSGLFGVGGGVLFVPLLILIHRFDPHLAIGTSLAVIVPTALIAFLRNLQAGMVHWPTVGVLVLLSLAGAWFGAGMSLKIDAALLRRLYAVFLFALSLKMFFRN